MLIQKNISLKNFNSFNISAIAHNFVEIRNLVELNTILQKNLSYKILGAGTNILLTRNINECLLLNLTSGIELLKKDNENVFLKVAGGENWHDFVLYCVENQYGGVENLSLIPGTVGAAPIQNIGAYGVELKDVFYELEAVELSTGKMQIFNNEACKFGYRDSVFKNELKDQFFIYSVTFKLNLNPVFNVNYGDIRQIIGDAQLSLKTISDAVINIRTSKLPDPKKLPNAGSFFKNPIIEKSKYEVLKTKFPNLPYYGTDNEAFVKVPAGWLIEQAGWKGKSFYDCGVHEKQALVLVNYGDAKGRELLSFANQIQKDILEKFSIELEKEVNIW
jgi:UDP-N-acetylmuramate dehydrogenase